jgi:hypothetical protein
VEPPLRMLQSSSSAPHYSITLNPVSAPPTHFKLSHLQTLTSVLTQRRPFGPHCSLPDSALPTSSRESRLHRLHKPVCAPRSAPIELPTSNFVSSRHNWPSINRLWCTQLQFPQPSVPAKPSLHLRSPFLRHRYHGRHRSFSEQQ